MDSARHERLTVTGSRDWDNYPVVERVLNSLDPSIISHGHARGADLQADEWALRHRVPAVPYAADWYPLGSFDRRAGHRRNQVQLDDFQPTAVVAFKDDFDFSLRAGGTEDMVRRALRAGVPTLVANAAGEVLWLPHAVQLPLSWAEPPSLD